MLKRYVATDPRSGEEVVNTIRVGKDAAIALVLLVVVMFVWPFYSVPTGSRGVVTQFGKIINIEGEGLAVLWPWQKLSNFSIRAETVNIEHVEGATADTQPVQVNMVVRYSIAPDKVAEVFEKYSHDGNLSSYAQTGTYEIFKAVTARYTAVNLIAERPKVSADIAIALREKLGIYGANVINIDMTNFAFSDTYMKAINDKVTQEQLRLAAENTLKTVEAQQKQKVAIATAEANAVKATADGTAYATITNAKANAEAARVEGEGKAKAMEAQAIALARNPALVELRKAEAWDGKLPVNMYGSAPVPFIRLSNEK